MRSQALTQSVSNSSNSPGITYISFPLALSLRYRWNKAKKLSISILNFYDTSAIPTMTLREATFGGQAYLSFIGRSRFDESFQLISHRCSREIGGSIVIVEGRLRF